MPYQPPETPTPPDCLMKDDLHYSRGITGVDMLEVDALSAAGDSNTTSLPDERMICII